MASNKSKFLIIIIFLCFNLIIFAQDISIFNGIWRGRSTNNPDDDAYIAINKTGENEFFVLYVNPFWEHFYNYSAYGEIDSNGFIHINTEKFDFFIEFTRAGNILHYINSLDDPQPSRFEKIRGRENGISNDVSLEDFLEFMNFLNSNQ